MLKVLVAIDGSTHSKAAVDAARVLASSTTALRIFRVLPVPHATMQGGYAEVVWHYPGAPTSPMAPVALAETRSQAMDRLRTETAERLEIVGRELRQTGSRVTCGVAFGDPAEEILNEAAGQGSDLVVVASHGLSGLRELVLGSVAASLIRARRLPVLVAPAAQ